MNDGRRPSLRVVSKDRVLLGAFFRWARRRGLCHANPVEDAPRWKVEEKEPVALTPEEVASLLAACREPYQQKVTRKNWRGYSTELTFLPPPHLYGIVLVALHSLLRFGNVLSLRCENVDLERGVIRIAAREVKTRRQAEIPMTSTLRGYFQNLPPGDPGASVFGDPVASIKRSFRSAAKRAGLPGLKFHTLRKTGATILLDAGVLLQVVQRMGGWKKPDVLLRHYAATTKEQRARAIEVLDKLGG